MMIDIMISRGKEKTCLFCDKCGDRYRWDEVLSKKVIYSIARRAGWRMGKMHLCNKCRNKKGDGKND